MAQLHHHESSECDSNQHHLPTLTLFHKCNRAISAADGITKLLREEGVFAMYRGLTPTILALLPSWAIYFPVYEHMKRRLSGMPAARHVLFCEALT
jgi:hypothetical protein